MRATLQRVTRASVTIDRKIKGQIGQGLVVFLGIKKGDGDSEINWMVEKVINLRIFEDKQEKMNLSLKDIGGEMLIISQFTLYGDCRKGRRPGFSTAAPPDKAEPLYERFVSEVEKEGLE